jgi:hypothetical protein
MVPRLFRSSQITKRVRKEHARVVHDGEGHARLLVVAEVLRGVGQLGQDALPCFVVALPECQYVREPNPPMCADFLAVDPSFIEKPNEEWPRDVQQIGSLLRGELGVKRHDRDPLAIRHRRQDFDEQLERQQSKPLQVVRITRAL